MSLADFGYAAPFDFITSKTFELFSFPNICDQIYQALTKVVIFLWVCTCPVSYINKNNCRDITVILLKVVLQHPKPLQRYKEIFRRTIKYHIHYTFFITQPFGPNEGAAIVMIVW